MFNIGERQQQIILRNMSVMFGAANYGHVGDVKLTVKRLDGGKDSYGRPVIAGFTVAADWVVLQNDNATLYELITSMAQDNYATLYLINSDGVNSIKLEQVLPIADFDVDGAGKISQVKMHAERVYSKSEISTILYNDITLNAEYAYEFDGSTLDLYQPVYFYMRPKLVYNKQMDRTYFILTAGGVSLATYQTNYLLYFDHATELFSTAVDIGPGVVGTDAHHPASLWVSADGVIVTAYDPLYGGVHNYGCMIKRSTINHDIDSMTTIGPIQANGSNLESAYPWLHEMADGRLIVGSRASADVVSHGAVSIAVSSDKGLTWGEAVTIISLHATGSDWAYSYPANGPLGTDLRIIINQVQNSGGTVDKVLVLRSADMETWSDEGQTFSKNITADGYITPSEALNYVVAAAPNDAVICLSRTGVVSPGNRFYLVWSDGTDNNNHEQFFSYWNGAAWTHTDITSLFPHAATGGTSAQCGLLCYDDLNFDLFAIQYDPSSALMSKLLRWRSTDRGATWTLAETLSNVATNRFAYLLLNRPQEDKVCLAVEQRRDNQSYDHDVFFKFYNKG